MAQYSVMQYYIIWYWSIQFDLKQYYDMIQYNMI